MYPAYDHILNHYQFNYEQLPNLKNVYIVNPFLQIKYSEQINFENIDYFTIDSAPLSEYPFSFGKLKHLVIQGCILNDEWCEFVDKLKHFNTLKMFNVCPTQVVPASRLLDKMLQSQNFISIIEELLIEFDYFTCPFAILHFLENTQNLKTLTLPIFDGPSRKTEVQEKLVKITSNLGFNWKYHVIDPSINPFNDPPRYCKYYS